MRSLARQTLHSWLTALSALERRCATKVLARGAVGLALCVEGEIKDPEPNLRCRIRQDKAVPVMDALHAWVVAQRDIVPKDPTRFCGNTTGSSATSLGLAAALQRSSRTSSSRTLRN